MPSVLKLSKKSPGPHTIQIFDPTPDMETIPNQFGPSFTIFKYSCYVGGVATVVEASQALADKINALGPTKGDTIQVHLKQSEKDPTRSYWDVQFCGKPGTPEQPMPEAPPEPAAPPPPPPPPPPPDQPDFKDSPDLPFDKKPPADEGDADLKWVLKEQRTRKSIHAQVALKEVMLSLGAIGEWNAELESHIRNRTNQLFRILEDVSQ